MRLRGLPSDPSGEPTIQGTSGSTASQFKQVQLERFCVQKHRRLFLLTGILKRWSFGGKVVYTKVSAGVWPQIGPIPAQAEKGTIGGQIPAETVVHFRFYSDPFPTAKQGGKCWGRSPPPFPMSFAAEGAIHSAT